ncbi:MAG: LPS export ABC transporter ATP-binding protein [Armatimonadota bacterium]
MRITLENLTKIYNNRRVVDNLSLYMEKGEVVGLLGPNGAGKTTTFYMVVGVVKPNAGKVYLDSSDITSVPMYKRATLGIGYLPQEASAFRRLTIEENILMIWEFSDMTRDQRHEELERLLREFDLWGKRKQYAFTLSGGERRRIEIARCLATKPHFLLLDEPFTGVDPIAISEIQDIIKKLQAKGMGVLITDHNVRETLKITDRAYIIREGNILVSGPSTEVAHSDLAKKHYLGSKFKLD